MAKAKSGAKKATPAAKKAKTDKLGLLKAASARVAKAAAKLVKGTTDKVAKVAPQKAKPAAAAAPKAKVPASAPKSAAAAAPARGVEKLKAAAETARAAAPAAKAAAKPGAEKPKGKAPAIERPKPRATKLPPVGEPLTKREMEQLLTAGQGRGVMGEGSLKGRLVLTDGFPHLVVTGRDKRELNFLLQGPDQEVFPAYMEHKVSVSGLIKKTTNYGGTVDVRKYSAKKTEAEPEAAPVETEAKLRYLSPGELAQVTSPGMGAGTKGFGSMRGSLEMTGDEYVLVVSNGGTRQQDSFQLGGKGTKGMRKFVGHTIVATGVIDKTSGWGGRVQVENFEPRPAEFRAVSRDEMEVTHVEGESEQASAEARLNHGLTVRLEEKPGFTWAIEPTTAKRVGLREANFESGGANAPASREFFFTPRNPGTFEVEFFLARAFNPGQVDRTFKLNVTVKP